MLHLTQISANPLYQVNREEAKEEEGDESKEEDANKNDKRGTTPIAKPLVILESSEFDNNNDGVDQEMAQNVLNAASESTANKSKSRQRQRRAVLHLFKGVSPLRD